MRQKIVLGRLEYPVFNDKHARIKFTFILGPCMQLLPKSRYQNYLKIQIKMLILTITTSNKTRYFRLFFGVQKLSVYNNK